jgi:hypothetical protein
MLRLRSKRPPDVQAHERTTRALTWIRAIAGIVAAIRGYVMAQKQTTPKRPVRAALSASDYSEEGFGVRVALVNRGLGGITVTGEQLLVDRRVVARSAAGWVHDPRQFALALQYRSARRASRGGGAPVAGRRRSRPCGGGTARGIGRRDLAPDALDVRVRRDSGPTSGSRPDQAGSQITGCVEAVHRHTTTAAATAIRDRG